MSRFYCPQWCHSSKGWIDLPSTASKKEKEANDRAELFAHEFICSTRVIRKPHGWKPQDSGTEEIPGSFTNNTVVRKYERIE